MCRWMGWSGQSLVVEDLLFKPKHGLIDQSLHSRWARDHQRRRLRPRLVRRARAPGALPQHPPGLGRRQPPRARRPHGVAALPRPRARHLRHGVQQTNCHPFRYGNWLFVHNGVIADFEKIRRELLLAVAPELFADIRGSTDSEVLFHLALTFGLERIRRRARAGRLRRGDGRRARHRARGADEPGPDRRRAPVGLPLLHRARLAHAVRLRRGSRRSARCTPTTRSSSGSATRTGSSSPSRSPTSRACGTRSPSRRC